MATSRSSRPHRATESPASRIPAPCLDWGDPSAVATWARDVYVQARDALAAGEDATRAPGRRELGRRAARRIIREAGSKIGDAFRFAGIDAPEGTP